MAEDHVLSYKSPQNRILHKCHSPRERMSFHIAQHSDQEPFCCSFGFSILPPTTSRSEIPSLVTGVGFFCGNSRSIPSYLNMQWRKNFFVVKHSVPCVVAVGRYHHKLISSHKLGYYLTFPIVPPAPNY